MLRYLTLEYWKDDGWYVGRLKETPGVFSQGETLSELEENVRDASLLSLFGCGGGIADRAGVGGVQRWRAGLCLHHTTFGGTARRLRRWKDRPAPWPAGRPHSGSALDRHPITEPAPVLQQSLLLRASAPAG